MVKGSIQEPTFLILTALAGGALHGYGIIGEVGELSGGRVTLRAGTLYAALDRLTDDGLIIADREEIVDGRLRRYYRLSDRGAGVLDEEVHRLRRNAQAAAERLYSRARGASGASGVSGLAQPGPA
jgi:DNA-binding PadR family transcriptional regulator